MDKDAIISVRNLTAGYGSHRVLSDLSIDFTKGRITTIVGGSGCGKSTLLKCIVGLLAPWSGEVTINNQILADLDEYELAQALSRVGMLFQQGAMLNSITVAENIALPLTVHTNLSRDVIDKIVQLKLDLVGLGHTGKMLPSELSGGMRKRAALARAMALDPEVLLCDEPSAGLDPQTAADLDALILNLKNTFKMTVIVVTHELASIDAIADDVVFLGHGGILHYSGTLEGAKASSNQAVANFFARRLPGMPAGAKSLLDVLQEGE